VVKKHESLSLKKLKEKFFLIKDGVKLVKKSRIVVF